MSDSSSNSSASSDHSHRLRDIMEQEWSRNSGAALASLTIKQESHETDMSDADPSSSDRTFSSNPLMESCDMCSEPFELSERKGQAEEESKLPRSLPCGHTYCTACISDMIKVEGLLKCPHQCKIKLSQQVESSLELAKNFTVMKMLTHAQHLGKGRERELHPHPIAHCVQLVPLPAGDAFDRAAIAGCIKAHMREEEKKLAMYAAVTQKRVASTEKQANELAYVKARADEEFKAADDAHSTALAQHKCVTDTHSAVQELLVSSDEHVVCKMGVVQKQLNAVKEDKALVALRAEGDSRMKFNSLASSSLILKGECRKDLDSVFMDIKVSGATLLYRGSRDGFGADAFWSKCEGKKRTFTLIKVQGNGYVMGAYLSVAMPSASSTQTTTADPHAFLVSLKNGHGVSIKMTLHPCSHAIGHYPDYGPSFGCAENQPGGADLLLGYDDSMNSQGCHLEPSAFQSTSSDIPYESTLLMQSDAPQPLYMSVRKLFEVEEVETWQLQ